MTERLSLHPLPVLSFSSIFYFLWPHMGCVWHTFYPTQGCDCVSCVYTVTANSSCALGETGLYKQMESGRGERENKDPVSIGQGSYHYMMMKNSGIMMYLSIIGEETGSPY